jgi:hypothetical protein
VTLRFAIRIVLVGLLTVGGALWHAEPGTGLSAANGASHRADFDTASPSTASPVVKSSADPDLALAGFLRLPWSGEDEESSKALASSFVREPFRGTDPCDGEAGAWLVQAASFLIPYKTGPPQSHS